MVFLHEFVSISITYSTEQQQHFTHSLDNLISLTFTPTEQMPSRFNPFH